MQFGMPTLIENHTLEENAALCETLGLRFIELNMNFPEYQADRLEQTEELARILSGTFVTDAVRGSAEEMKFLAEEFRKGCRQ